MNRGFKKLFCLLLTLLFVFSSVLFAIPAGADDFKNKSWSNDWGDIDHNGKANSADARIALRAAAKLEKLNATQIADGDVNRDGIVNSSDARQILRVAARLDQFRVDVELPMNQEYVIDSVVDKGAYRWVCATSQGLSFEQTFKELPPDSPPGKWAERVYTFKAEEPGKYEAIFKLIDWDGTIANEIIVTFTVSE